MTLRELRTARKLTQVRLARTLGITQDSASPLEKRSDFLPSTLRKTVEAMGGNLSLVAEFPDPPPDRAGRDLRGRRTATAAQTQVFSSPNAKCPGGERWS
jgi:transcriptional regulator with XRE-family HTH domain